MDASTFEASPMPRLFFALLLSAALASAETPKVKSVEKNGDREAVTLESGAFAKIYAPATIAKGAKPGLVVALHGMGGAPDDMLDWGKKVAEHRRDVWCAVRGSMDMKPGWGWDIPKDVAAVVEMTRYAVARHGADPKRVVVIGFSAGGLMALYSATKNKDLFAGWIACASRGWPGTPGTDAKGQRAVLILGTDDPVFKSVEDARKGIERAGKGFSLWVVENIGHALPDAVYANDALTYVLDARVADGEKKLPAKADHGLAAERK
jgi:predicted esterase